MRALLQPIKEDAVNNVMGVVFQSLRATLGAQFTQREAERLVAAAYNPKLTEQQNLTRLERAKKILEETVKAKDQLLAWGSSGQRLSDYKGPLPIDVYRSSVANLKNELDAPTVGDDNKKPLVIKERK
jgi:hypothetical protein